MLIQIVDDSANMRGAIKSVLGGLSAEFIESSDGDEAVKQFALHRPDLVIMDIRMERMDGIAATRAIRRQSPLAQVVMMTQYDDDDLRTAARDAGAAGYILKDDLSRILDFIHHT
jgi:DNA-binding NarL/FixJ family response regulator